MIALEQLLERFTPRIGRRVLTREVDERGDARAVVQIRERLEGLRSHVLRFLREREPLEKPGGLGCVRASWISVSRLLVSSMDAIASTASC